MEVRLAPRQVLAGHDRKIHRLAFAAYRQAGVPRRVALFATRPHRQGMRIFFTPEATRLLGDLIAHYESSVCPAPVQEDVELMVGHPYAGIWLLDWL